MPAPAKINFKIYQGNTLAKIIRWESATMVYKAITAITKAAPCIVTAVGHSIPEGWRFKITDVAGMKEINSTDNYNIAAVKTVDTIEINALNSSGFTAYTSGGVLSYNAPVDLVGYTARMQLRASLTDTATLDTLTTENGKIAIDTAIKTITLNLTATATAPYTWSSAVYSLEMVSPTGVVETIATGTITLVKEVTR